MALIEALCMPRRYTLGKATSCESCPHWVDISAPAGLHWIGVTCSCVYCSMNTDAVCDGVLWPDSPRLYCILPI